MQSARSASQSDTHIYYAHVVTCIRYIYWSSGGISMYTTSFQPRTLCRYFSVILESVTKGLYKPHFTVFMQSKYNITFDIYIDQSIPYYLIWLCIGIKSRHY